MPAFKPEITAAAEKDQSLWTAQRGARVALAMEAWRDTARISREEDAWINAGRPYQALGGEPFHKVVAESYERFAAGILAANRGQPVNDNRHAANGPAPVCQEPVVAPKKRRRLAAAPV